MAVLQHTVLLNRGLYKKLRNLKYTTRNFVISSTKFCENPDNKKYKDTVLLPSTTFPLYLKGKKVVENEKYVQEAAGFSSLYAWQQSQSRDKEYILHDGPPYANGQPHIGHAVNKILKDITVRHKLLRGYKVHFVPGWDCHGLPIELKATERHMKKRGAEKARLNDPLTLRATAKAFAEEAIQNQQKAFERWGILADWSNVYRTFDPQYIHKQLHLFAELYEKGYVYQAYKPVYFSPSSKTTLAEAELEYVSDHKSPSLYVAFPASNLPEIVQEALHQNGNPQVYLAVWTTTPWTLPANEAICFSKDKMYSLTSLSLNEKTLFVIWAKELIEELKTFAVDVSEVCSFEGSYLTGVTYRHPVSERQCQVLHGDHVTMAKGTGLVHTAPAHGQEDFLVALQHNLSLICKIDEQGCYDSDCGYDLGGKSVLDEGNDAVIKILTATEGRGGPSLILNLSTFIHSYPYDWRTKKPVIIRASEQWFIDTEKLKDKALEALKDVEIIPSNIDSFMEGMLRCRSYWCISRQRVWGCPIPVFYDVATNQPVTNREIIEHTADVIKTKGANAWWELPEEELLPLSLVKQYESEGKKLPRKGCDIFDIWFDSGSSWHSVLGTPSADLYLEGSDQFTGWFQSSLLTSVAVTGRAPYRKLYVHGFTVDETGKKMSKSLGNVVDPKVVTDGGKNLKKNPAYGADVLRFWVGLNATKARNLMVGQNVLEDSYQGLQKVRVTLRFLLSAVADYNPCQHSLPISALRPIDQYMLHLLCNHVTWVWENYEKYYYRKVMQSSLTFVSKTVSAFYIHLVRDRLYCESRWSPKRISALVVLHHLLNHLLFTLAPVLPHLAEEITLHNPVNKELRFFHQQTSGAPSAWNQPEIAKVFRDCHIVRNELDQSHMGMKPYTMQMKITAGGQVLKSLKVLQTSEESEESGLCEFMQAARIFLVEDDKEGFSVEASPSENGLCLRCRKLTVQKGKDLCSRCEVVISSGW